MECKESTVLLPAQVDRELGPSDALRVEQHLQTCAACHAEYAQFAAVRAVVKKHATYFSVPDDLLRRIKRALPAPVPARNPRAWSWPNAGALFATVLAAAWSLGLYLTLPTATDRLGDEVVANYVRSQISGHATDVTSTDQHTVKPWFNDKLDFSPPVSDLTAEGFPLVGGRVDYLDHRPVAALVYRRNQHAINVFIAPASTANDFASGQMARRGYHLLHWIQAGMDIWVVSDVEAAQLARFKNLLRTSMPAA